MNCALTAPNTGFLSDPAVTISTLIILIAVIIAAIIFALRHPELKGRLFLTVLLFVSAGLGAGFAVSADNSEAYAEDQCAYSTGDDNSDGSGIQPPPAIITMQSMTAAYCATLETYYGETYAQANGTDEASKLISLVDVRDGQYYTVGKLADGNCWMLDNLKLGTQSGPMLLTPADTNITANWTLPKLGPGAASYDQPEAIGPVPGDTGVGATNYGYLYNWCAATAGDPGACTPNGASVADATRDICPTNWRLPKGGSFDNANNEFSQLSAKMAGFADNQDAVYLGDPYDYREGWLFDGAFRGVRSGGWNAYMDFDGQGSWAVFLSASAGTYPDEIWTADITQSYAYLDYLFSRDNGAAIRCLVR